MSSGRSPEVQAQLGRGIAAIAAETGRHPADVLFDLALADDLDTVFHWSNETPAWRELLKDVQLHPQMIVGVSDGGAHLDRDDGQEWSTHFLATWWRGERVWRLEEAVRRITAIPAAILGLHDRGLLAVGRAADLFLFDPDAIDVGTCREEVDPVTGAPRFRAVPKGIAATIVNGSVVVERGERTGARPGRGGVAVMRETLLLGSGQHEVRELAGALGAELVAVPGGADHAVDWSWSGPLEAWRASVESGPQVARVVVAPWADAPEQAPLVEIDLDAWLARSEVALARWVAALGAAKVRCADGGAIVAVVDRPAPARLRRVGARERHRRRRRGAGALARPVRGPPRRAGQRRHHPGAAHPPAGRRPAAAPGQLPRHGRPRRARRGAAAAVARRRRAHRHRAARRRREVVVMAAEPKVVLVTGASGGVGRGIAIACGQAGWTVWIAARREAQAAEVAAEVDAAGGQGRAIVVRRRRPVVRDGDRRRRGRHATAASTAWCTTPRAASRPAPPTSPTSPSPTWATTWRCRCAAPTCSPSPPTRT